MSQTQLILYQLPMVVVMLKGFTCLGMIVCYVRLTLRTGGQTLRHLHKTSIKTMYYWIKFR